MPEKCIVVKTAHKFWQQLWYLFQNTHEEHIIIVDRYSAARFYVETHLDRTYSIVSNILYTWMTINKHVMN